MQKFIFVYVYCFFFCFFRYRILVIYPSKHPLHHLRYIYIKIFVDKNAWKSFSLPTSISFIFRYNIRYLNYIYYQQCIFYTDYCNFKFKIPTGRVKHSKWNCRTENVIISTSCFPNSKSPGKLKKIPTTIKTYNFKNLKVVV